MIYSVFGGTLNLTQPINQPYFFSGQINTITLVVWCESSSFSVFMAFALYNGVLRMLLNVVLVVCHCSSNICKLRPNCLSIPWQ